MATLTFRQEYATRMPEVAVPETFAHTEPTGKPTRPDNSTLTASELAQVESWRETRNDATVTEAAAVSKMAEWKTFYGQYEAWKYANFQAMRTQFRLSRADAMILNEPTTSVSGDPSEPLPAPPPGNVERQPT